MERSFPAFAKTMPWKAALFEDLVKGRALVFFVGDLVASFLIALASVKGKSL